MSPKLASFYAVGDFTVCKGFDSATIFACYFPFSLQTNRDWRFLKLLFETWTKILLSKLAVHFMQLSIGC